MDWQDQGLIYDIAVHLGSLFAVVLYLREDLKQIFTAWVLSLSAGKQTHESLLFWYVAVASVPIAVGGYLMRDVVATYLRSPMVIAISTIVFGLLLWWADVTGKRLRDIEKIGLRDAIIIGLSQVMAIVPGTSRSGITITAGLMLGLERRTAARFSFLLSIPTILMAGGYEAFRYFSGAEHIDWGSFFSVAVISAITAWLAIHYFLKFLEKTGMLPYVIYRLLLGAVLIVMFA